MATITTANQPLPVATKILGKQSDNLLDFKEIGGPNERFE
jgi:hypothetical protein